MADQADTLLSATGSRPPDFLCIGAQKAGTTWLHANLARHPDIWMPAIKELQYFNELHIPGHKSWTVQHRRQHAFQALRGYMARTDKSEHMEWDFVAQLVHVCRNEISDAWYLEQFSFAAGKGSVGEVTPEYSILPAAGIDHVLRLSPDIKIIFMVRDPIERAWSHMRMLISHDQTTPDLDRICRMASLPDVLSRSDYGTILSNWLAKIKPEQMLLLNYDDLQIRPTEVLKDVCRFLAIDYSETVSRNANKPIHVGEAREMPPEVLAILKRELANVYAHPHPLLRRAFEPWVLAFRRD